MENIIAAQSQVLRSRAASLTWDHFQSFPSMPWLFALSLLATSVRHSLITVSTSSLPFNGNQLVVSLQEVCRHGRVGQEKPHERGVGDGDQAEEQENDLCHKSVEAIQLDQLKGAPGFAHLV